MLINLVPRFIDAFHASDSHRAYRLYIEENKSLLEAYWHNYVLDIDSPHAEEVIERTLSATRYDLEELLDNVDIEALVTETTERAEELLQADTPIDVVLMVGVGAANAGELVVNGRGIAFICLEHFTGRANPETYGLGLKPETIPLWLAHEIAHAVRYTSPESESEMAKAIRDEGGYYDYWESGSRVRLAELILNEGLAVLASRAVAPGFEPWDYLGYARRQYRRLRELEAFLRSATATELDRTGLGLRLKYLSGGMTPAQRLLQGKVIPERAGYYLGYRFAEPIVSERGIARALRSSAQECLDADRRAAEIQTA